MSNTPKLSRFVRGTLRFNLIRTLCLNVDSHGVESRKSTSGMMNRQQEKRFVSIRQHFHPTLHSPPEVKIREIMTHEPSSFLKRGHKLQSIHTIRTTFSTHPAEPTRSQDTWNNDTWTFLVLKTWPQTSVDSYDSCRFDWIHSNWQYFQPTLKVQINYIF